MTLEEIYLKEDISLRAINSCKLEGLYNLKTIAEFYKANGTFLGLRNCGSRTNRELIDLCNKYESKINIFTNENQYVTALANLDSNGIKFLNNFIQFEFGLLSVRSKNILRYILDNNFDILNFIEKFHLDKDFDIYKVRNAGDKSVEELHSFIKKVEFSILQSAEMDFNSANDQLGENAHFDEEINPTLGQIIAINNFIVSEFGKLSVRVQNSLIDLLDHNLDIRNFSDKIFLSEDFAFYKLRNIGAKSVLEFNEFVQTVTEYVTSITNYTEQNSFDPNVMRHFGVKGNNLNSYTSIFQSVNEFINQNKIYKKATEKLIFQEGLKIYANNQEQTLEDLGEKLNLTRERIRQIRNRIIAEISQKFHFIKEFREDLFEKYNIDLTGNKIVLDTPKFESINNLNKTGFSAEFITFLIYIYVSDEFDLIGNIEDVLQYKNQISRNRHNWKNFYIINKSFVAEFDFEAFINDIETRLQERFKETYCLNFKNYLFNFLLNSNSENLFIISAIAEEVLNLEFEIFVEEDDSIKFGRNKPKHVGEYAIDALERLGTPSRLEEIYNLIEKTCPGVTKSQGALRGSLQRTPEIIYFGRSSTYGLKKWENENIRGGTIKDIVEEYLKYSDTPIHLSEVVDYVNKFRNTTIKNLSTNLKLGNQNRFCFFENSYVGLTNKVYSMNSLPLVKKINASIFSPSKMIKYQGVNFDNVVDLLADKYGYPKVHIYLILNSKIREQIYSLDSDKNLKIDILPPTERIDLLMSNLSSNQLETLKNKIETGNRLEAFFFFYNIFSKKYSKKQIDASFEKLWSKHLS